MDIPHVCFQRAAGTCPVPLPAALLPRHLRCWLLPPPSSLYCPPPQVPSHLLSVSKSWYDLGFDRLVARFEDGMRNRSLGEERVFSLPTLLFSHPVWGSSTQKLSRMVIKKHWVSRLWSHFYCLGVRHWLSDIFWASFSLSAKVRVEFTTRLIDALCQELHAMDWKVHLFNDEWGRLELDSIWVHYVFEESFHINNSRGEVDCEH